MANNIIRRTWKQGGLVNIEDLRGFTFQDESEGHTFLISGVDADGNPMVLSGSPAGVLLRPDQMDVALECAVSDGVVTATLPAECYDVPGRIGITIFLSNGDQKVCIYAAIASVSRTSSGTVSPGTTSDVVDLINRINEVVATIPLDYSALSQEVVDLKSAIKKKALVIPSKNLANFDYWNPDGSYGTYKYTTYPINTGLRIEAHGNITNSCYVYYLLPIADFIGKTVYFHANIDKSTNPNPRFAWRYYNATTDTLGTTTNSNTTGTLEFTVNQSDVETNGWTHIRFQFHITRTTASVVSGDYVEFKYVGIYIGENVPYVLPDAEIRYDPQLMNNVEYIIAGEDCTNIYFESANDGIYFKYSGNIYLRGSYQLRTLKMTGTASQTTKLFSDASELVTSPNGVTGCFLIPLNKYVYYDFADDCLKLSSENLSSVDPSMFVIFINGNGIISGGHGMYIYQQYITNELERAQKYDREYAVLDGNVYFEKSGNDVYFKHDGSIYLRGAESIQRTLRMSYSGTSDAVRTFDSIETLVTSPEGETGCLLIQNNYAVCYDFINDCLTKVQYSSLTPYMYVLMYASGGIISGGALQYAYTQSVSGGEISHTLERAWNVCVQTVQSAQKKQFVFGVQSDTHFKTDSAEGIARQMGVLTQYVGMDFIANLGDLIHGYATDSLEDSRKDMTDIVNRYIESAKCPVLFSVGNHDDGVLYTTSNGTQHYSLDEIITGNELYGRIGKPMYNTSCKFVHGKELYYYIDFDDVRVICLNTRDLEYIGVVGSGVSGADVSINGHKISQTQVDWFVNVLQNSMDKKVIVMSHVGLIESVRPDNYGVTNSSAIISAMESFVGNGGTIIGAFSGHAHAQMSDKVNGINYIGFDNGGGFAEIVMIDTDENARTIKTTMVGNIPSGDTDRTFTY